MSEELEELRILYLKDEIGVWELFDMMLNVIHRDKSESERKIIRERILNTNLSPKDDLYRIAMAIEDKRENIDERNAKETI